MYNTENEQENSSEFSPENQEHLLRMKNEYLNDLTRQQYIKDWIETILFNSFNVTITLYLISLGMGLIVASFAGFSVGAFPGFKNFSENFNSEMNINGKLIQGLIRIVSAGCLTFFIGGQWQSLEKMSRLASDFYNRDIQTYEYSQKPESVSFETRFLITAGLGATAGAVVLSLLKKSDD